MAPDLDDREVFTCGPPGYLLAARAALTEAGADPRRCHEESFEPTAVGPPRAVDPADPPAAPDTGFSVELRRSGLVLRCDPQQTLLDAVLRAGGSVPSSCGEGVCGTCKTPVLTGTVDMAHAGGIRPREIAQDLILLCCSTPRTDLVLDA